MEERVESLPPPYFQESKVLPRFFPESKSSIRLIRLFFSCLKFGLLLLVLDMNSLAQCEALVLMNCSKGYSLRYPNFSGDTRHSFAIADFLLLDCFELAVLKVSAAMLLQGALWLPLISERDSDYWLVLSVESSWPIIALWLKSKEVFPWFSFSSALVVVFNPDF